MWVFHKSFIVRERSLELDFGILFGLTLQLYAFFTELFFWIVGQDVGAPGAGFIVCNTGLWNAVDSRLQ